MAAGAACAAAEAAGISCVIGSRLKQAARSQLLLWLCHRHVLQEGQRAADCRLAISTVAGQGDAS